MAMSIAVESAVAGLRVIWGAPTFDQVRISWDETKHGVGNVAEFNISRMVAEFPTGGTIIYRSLDDPDNARGHTADGVVIDEVGDVKPEAWHEVLRPMLMDTGGWLWGIGTPRGRNWFWQEHLRAVDLPDSMAWQVPTLGVAIENGVLVRRPHPLENPNVPFAEIERIWQTVPERVFQQEILAQFLDQTGGIFRRITEATTATRQDAGEGTRFGVDWGKHQDWTVITVLDRNGQMVAWDRFNQIDYALQTQRLKAMADKYKPSVIVAEANAMGEPIIEQLRRDNLPVVAFTTTAASKAQMVEGLALAFEKGEIKILPEPVLVNELQAFEMTRLPGGGIRYAAPEGLHDDCVISLALAWWGTSRALTGSLMA